MTGFEQFKIWVRYSPITASLLILSILVSLVSNFGNNFQFIHFLLISEYTRGLSEVMDGQLWRLFTPIIIHFGILHIVFNMVWLYQLGSAIEQHYSIKRMAILVVIIALSSNLAELAWSGPLFGGMSGVVYGLLGYIWVQGKFNPHAAIGLNQNIAIMMLAWFVICWLGLVGNIANMAHTVGLVAGILLGVIYTPRFKMLFRKR
ncbi:MAG: rhomboid family intramembrane serine protease [Gammaproteobacteria bacterium]|nr:rhomboid family intramembrane serine protease [Gammaproteobacteria bacterium]